MQCASAFGEVTHLNLYRPPHVPVAHLKHLSPTFHKSRSYGFKVLAHKRHRSVRPGRQSKVGVTSNQSGIGFLFAKPGNTLVKNTRELV